MHRCHTLIALLALAAAAQAQTPGNPGLEADSTGVGTAAVTDVNEKSRISAATTVFGDVNGDSKVDAVDVVDIVRYTKGKQRSAFQKAKADINGDGTVNLDDARALSAYIADGTVPAGNSEGPQGSSITDPGF